MANDEKSLANTLKLLTMNAIAESKPTDLVVGTVISTNPLQIRVSDKLVLDKEFLMLSSNVVDITRDVTVDWKDEPNTRRWTHNHDATSSSNSTSSASTNVDTDVTGTGDAYVNGATQSVSHNHGLKIDRLKDGSGKDCSYSMGVTSVSHAHAVNITAPVNMKLYARSTADTSVSTYTTTTTHIDDYTDEYTHQHAIKGRKKMIIHNALKQGERVAMIRFANGQMYYVMDRIY